MNKVEEELLAAVRAINTSMLLVTAIPPYR